MCVSVQVSAHCDVCQCVLVRTVASVNGPNVAVHKCVFEHV